MSVPFGGTGSGYSGQGAGGYISRGGADGGPPARIDWRWIGECWDLFWRAAGIWVLAVIGYGIVHLAVRIILSSLFPGSQTPLPAGMNNPALMLLTKLQLSPPGIAASYAVNWLVDSFQSASLYAMAVKQIRGQSPSVRDIVGGGRYLGAMLVLNLLVTLLLIAGALVLCVGYLAAWAFTLISPVLVAEGDSAVTALSRSFAAMKQDWVNGSLFLLVWALTVVASAVPCGLGLLATLPMKYLLAAVAYRDMIGIPGVAAAGFRGYGAVPQYYETQPGSWPPAPGPAYRQDPAPDGPWPSPRAQTPESDAPERDTPESE